MMWPQECPQDECDSDTDQDQADPPVGVRADVEVDAIAGRGCVVMVAKHPREEACDGQQDTVDHKTRAHDIADVEQSGEHLGASLYSVEDGVEDDDEHEHHCGQWYRLEVPRLSR